MSSAQAKQGAAKNNKKAAGHATLQPTSSTYQKSPFWDTTYRRDYCKGVNGWTFKDYSEYADDEAIAASVRTRSLLLNPLWESTYRRDYCNGSGCMTAPIGTRVMTRSLGDEEDKDKDNHKVWLTTYQHDFCSRYQPPKY